MNLTSKDGLNARNLFHKHFMVLLGLLSKPFEFNKQNQLTEVIEILSKLLFVIEKTHLELIEGVFDDRALSGILNFVAVRQINRKYDFKDVINKYEMTLNSIKTLSNIFYSKDLTFHKTLWTLNQYTNSYNNILSRSTLMFNFTHLSTKPESDIIAFFVPYVKNEVLLYIPFSAKNIITNSIVEKSLENSYTIFYDTLTKYTFDKEKQFINIQKVFKELNLLIKLTVS